MKKSTWGPIYWNILHCLAIHIKEEYFESEISILWSNIMGIINNLPCPYCRQHATTYIKKVTHKSFKNKTMLIKFMHNFHSEVNERLKKINMPYDEHIEHYKKMNPKDVFVEFLNKNINDKNSVKMMLYSFHMKNFIRKFNVYLGQNIHKFL